MADQSSAEHRHYGVKERSFQHCPFKVMLPKVAVLDEVVHIVFSISSRQGFREDVALDEANLSDKLNRKYDLRKIGECKLWEESGKGFSFDVPIENRKFRVQDAVLILHFLASDHCGYEVCYSLRSTDPHKLVYVVARQLNPDQELRLTEYIQARQDETYPSGAPDTGGPDGPDPIDGDGNGSGGMGDPIPGLEEYKKALLREKYFLQNEGGRRHKVTNGVLINHKNGLSTYSFEMETELNLSDDAPITLYVGANEATGSVLVCDGFQIIVIVDKGFGTTIAQALLGVEPWKLLEALVKKLDSISSDSRLAMKLINQGPGLATMEPSSAIPKGQDAALEKVRNSDITVIWGPPGTGKTYTMAQIAREALQNGKTILAVSHSNVSVDGIVKQTVAGLRNAGMGSLLTEGKILRYGYVRDEELSMDSFAVAYNYVLNHRPELKERVDCLHRERDRLRGTGEYHSPRGEQIEKELKKLRAEVRAGERYYVSKAKMVATTISKVTVDSLFDEKTYDIVMFDEVSMAYVPQIVCAASYARKKMVLVGDFRQLAPIVQSDAKKVLGVDIFSYLGISDGGKACLHPWLVMLNEQRRMHPAISAFPNEYIYERQLRDHVSVRTNRNDIVQRRPLAGSAANLISLSGSYCASMKNSDNSRFNILSAIISFFTALQAEQNGEKSIGIITPYAAQTRLIRAMIQDYRKNENTDIACSTVHQFQGSERNAIIFDAVESYPSSKVGWLMGKDLDSVSRLINVAVTRARGKLVVVANEKFWENKFAGTRHTFYRLVQYLMKSANVISMKEKKLATYIQQLPSTGNICLYSNLSEGIAGLKKDIERAHEKIVISIPDGRLDSETQDTVLRIITDAAKKGIRILAKTGDYENLPEGWKQYTWGTENAIFPLIVIDDKVAWYGLPKSRGEFRDGNSLSITVCQTIYRIRGEHTLEMIKAFSDLEYRVVNGQRTPLLEKKEKKRPGPIGDGPSGIDKFIREREKCPICKSSMKVTRSRNGKVFLKCSSPSCKEIAYLTPDVINWYIDREHVTCPIHHLSIYARLGKYGPYVRCEAGHYLKPDEI